MSVNLRANQSKALWYHLGALLTVTAWGVSFVSTKVLLEHGINPTEVYVVRTLLAYLLVCVP